MSYKHVLPVSYLHGEYIGGMHVDDKLLLRKNESKSKDLDGWEQIHVSVVRECGKYGVPDRNERRMNDSISCCHLPGRSAQQHIPITPKDWNSMGLSFC